MVDKRSMWTRSHISQETRFSSERIQSLHLSFQLGPFILFTNRPFDRFFTFWVGGFWTGYTDVKQQQAQIYYTVSYLSSRDRHFYLFQLYYFFKFNCTKMCYKLRLAYLMAVTMRSLVSGCSCGTIKIKATLEWAVESFLMIVGNPGEIFQPSTNC